MPELDCLYYGSLQISTLSFTSCPVCGIYVRYNSIVYVHCAGYAAIIFNPGSWISVASIYKYICLPGVILTEPSGNVHASLGSGKVEGSDSVSGSFRWTAPFGLNQPNDSAQMVESGS